MKTANTTTQKNVLLYDWIRLLATITVVIGHSYFLSIYSPLGSISYSLPTELGNIWSSSFFKFWEFLSTWVYSFHMPLFFFLSGAVLALKPLENLKTFIYKKAKRLLIPFLSIGFCFFLPILFLINYYSFEQTLKIIINFLLGFESGYLWFLPALFWTMLCFALLKILIKKFTKNNFYILLFLAFVIQINVIHIPDYFKFSTGLIHIFWFSLGYCFEEYWRPNLNLTNSIILFFLTLILEIIQIKNPIFSTYSMYIIGGTLIISISNILCTILKDFCTTPIYKIIIRNLFYIYLFHVPLEYIILKATFDYNLLSTNWGCILYLFFRTVGVFIISLIIGELIHHLKTIRKRGISKCTILKSTQNQN